MLDKLQIKLAVEKDDMLKKIEQEKQDRLREQGKRWMKNAEDVYAKKVAT